MLFMPASPCHFASCGRLRGWPRRIREGDVVSRRTSHPLSPACKPPREGPPDGSYQSYRSPGFEIWKLSDPARPPMRAPSRHMSASAAFLGAAPCFFNDVDGHTYHAMPCRADLHGPSQTHDMTTMVAFESACNLFLRTNAQHTT